MSIEKVKGLKFGINFKQNSFAHLKFFELLHILEIVLIFDLFISDCNNFSVQLYLLLFDLFPHKNIDRFENNKP